ncbi:MAG: hypothetical protein AAF141_02780 [Pseudomonadota bacterium]
MSSLDRYKSGVVGDWTARVWDGLIDSLKAEFAPLQEQLGVQRELTDAIVARGLRVIEDELAPVVAQGTGVLGDITSLRQAATDLVNEIQAQVDQGIPINEILGLETALEALANHAISELNPHSVTKAQVGLGNADNTADADKPISTATQSALGNKLDTAVAASSYVRKDLEIETEGRSRVQASANLSPAVRELRSDGEKHIRLSNGAGAARFDLGAGTEAAGAGLYLNEFDDAGVLTDTILSIPRGGDAISLSRALRNTAQPAMTHALGTGQHGWAANSHYGFPGTFAEQQGGFTKGATINGFGEAIHFPKGSFIICVQLYSTNNPASAQNQRHIIMRNGNNSDVLGMPQDWSTDTSGTRTTIGFAKMNDGDFLTQYVPPGYVSNFFGVFQHSQITAFMIG